MVDTPTGIGTTPSEMAKVLLRASANSAAAYALAAHETACELRDETSIAFWRSVGRELDSKRDEFDDSRALKVA